MVGIVVGSQTSLGGKYAGEWRLAELIGKGGTASVYRGEHADGRVGAVKVMHAHLAYERDWTRRLRREAALLGSVEHPGLVRLLDVGQLDGGGPFLVMELFEGRSLEEMRRALAGPMPAADVLRYAEAVLDVLSHTHGLGIVHRDLKPSNVFVTAAGELKVLDFGIASGIALETGDATQSATRGILGTPAYMAPEQARGRWELVDHRADLWAVGAMIFALCSGQYVHVALTENERLGLAMSRPARSLGSVMAGLPVGLVEVVDRALEYDIARRWQSAGEFRDALAAVAAGRGATLPVFVSGEATVRDASATSPPALRGSRKALVVALLVAIVIAAAVVAFGPWKRAAPEAEPVADRSPSEVRAPAPKTTARAPAPTVPSAAPALVPTGGGPGLSRGEAGKPASGRRSPKPGKPETASTAKPPIPLVEDLMDRRE